MTEQIKERELKELLSNNSNNALVMTWDIEQQLFRLYLKIDDDIQPIYKWKGGIKTFVFPALAIDWAREMGFNKIQLDDIEIGNLN